jgi:hypothetical protein
MTRLAAPIIVALARAISTQQLPNSQADDQAVA